MKLGSLDIIPIWDGRMVFVAGDGYPPRDSPEFEPHSRYITIDGEYHADLGAFLVATGDQLVLLDAGLGPNEFGLDHLPSGDGERLQAFLDVFKAYGLTPEEMKKREENLRRQRVSYGNLEENLAKVGVKPEDITDVVLSHMHPDHIGWATKNGKPFFTNAKVWAHQADIDHFMSETPPDESGFKVMLGTEPTAVRLAPAREHFEVWTNDTVVAPGINLRHLPGHTPGNALIVVSSNHETAYVLGDTIHCPMELVDPNFHIQGDLDPAMGQMQKAKVRKEIEDGKIAVASPHFPDLAFGRLFVDDSGARWQWVD